MDTRGELLTLASFSIEQPIHLVGIGGAGMSAIATVLLQMGYRVEGSDIKESPNIRRLRQRGAVVGIGHRGENIGTASVVVRSSAIRRNNPEIVEAERQHIPVVDRAEMLSAIMATRDGIAIAGTHGKTTTSSLVTQMLLECGEDPSYLIGGELNETGGNAHYGTGAYLVAEADESDGSLLYLRPRVVVLTNADWDHLDYYESAAHTEEVFARFLELLPSDGLAVVCGDDPGSRRVGEASRSAGGTIYFYGEAAGNDYRFDEAGTGADGGTFVAYYRDEKLVEVHTGAAGMHNIFNSLAALAVGHQLGLDPQVAARGLSLFGGVRRRFETIGVCCGMQVIDDYAHHPAEVKAVLDLALRVAEGRVVVVFQPHRYSRTRMLAEQFGDSFKGADLVVVTDIYGAGEEPEPGVTGKLVAESIAAQDGGTEVAYVAKRTELAGSVVPLLREGDMVITMGAGDVTHCAREILELLAARES